MTPASLRTLKDIHRRCNGCPCGVPADNRSANALLRGGYLRWAAPFWNYPKHPKTYGLTTLGRLVAEGIIEP